MKFSLLTCLAIAGINCFAQNDHISAIRVGDKFPDHKLANMINYRNSEFDMKDYRGKLVILDMWGTTCGSCVAAWPKILTLQKEFADQVQFVLLNKYESREVVKDYISRRRKLKGVDMTLPVSCRDSVTWQVMPENGVPRYYWFDKDGALRSVTYGESVNAKNIRKWLTSGPHEMPQMIDSALTVDRSLPIFMDGNGGSGHASKVLWTSILTSYTPGVTDFGINADEANGYGITLTSASIDALYRFAYYPANEDSLEYPILLPVSRRKLAIRDSTRVLAKLDGETNFEELYNYQLLTKAPSTRRELLLKMQEDLRRYFGYRVSWQMIRQKCLVWTMQDSSKAVYKEGIRDVYLNDTEVIFDGVTVDEAIRFMENASAYFYTPFPIVNETNFLGKLGIRTNCDCHDPKSLDNAVRRFGLRFGIQEREVRVLMVQDSMQN